MSQEKPTKSFAFVNLQRYALVIGLLILLFIFLYFIYPFFAVLIVAGVLAVDLFPFNDWLTKKLRYRSIASLISTILVLIVLVTPFVIFSIMLIQEVVDLSTHVYNTVSAESFTFASLLPEFIRNSSVGDFITNTVAGFDFNEEQIRQLLRESSSSITSVGTEIFNQTTNIFRQLTLALGYSIVFMICLFYFFYNGNMVVERLKKLIPLPVRYKDELFTRLSQLSKGIIYSIFGAAIVQGVAGGIGVAIAGVSNAVLWGFMMAIFSPVPYLGAALVWAPMTGYLFLTGDWGSGTVLLIWSMVVVSNVDNLVKPYLIGKSVAINPLLVLLTMVGGVLMIGLEALIFGPFLLSLLFSLLHIYELEYQDVLKS